MKKRIIIIIASALAVILIGAVIVFSVLSSNDNAKNYDALNDKIDKDSISTETDDSNTTAITDPDTDDTELKETDRDEADTENPSDDTTQNENETKPSNKEPSDTEAPSKNPADTKPSNTKPAETKPSNTKPAETKPADTKPADTKPAQTKPIETKPQDPDRDEPFAPNFTIYDGNGNAVRLSDFKGKPVILNFWASWCTPCKKEMPDFNEKYLEYGDEIQFLMIDFAKDDNIEDAKAYVAEMEFAFPIYFDTYGDAAKTYGVIGFPTTVFIDSDGYIMDSYRGTISEERLLSGINKILE